MSDREKHVQTTREGTYALHLVLGLPGHHVIPDLTYRKAGYVTREFVKNEVGEEGLVVVLTPQIPLDGQVLGPDGQPVKRFAVCAGPGGVSSEYVSLESVERIVQDATGRFKLWLDRPGRTWVGVRASRYASGEVLTDVPRSGGSLVVRLESGARITGKIVAPSGGLQKLEARLVQRGDVDGGRGFGSTSQVKEWFSLATTVNADGTLRFDDVRPDRYALSIYGPTVSPKMLLFDVPAGGLDLGVVRLSGRGRIRGRVFDSKDRGGEVRLFATGRVTPAPVNWIFRRCHEEVEFMSDEDGRFSVEGVPDGLVRVGFPDVSGDVVVIESQAVEVCEGQTTEMRVLGPTGSRSMPFDLRVGDGSQVSLRSGSGLGASRRVANVTTLAPKLPSRDSFPSETTLTLEPLFRLELIPRSGQPLSSVHSDWERVDGKGRVVLYDVSPGAYRLRLVQKFDQTIFGTETVFEQSITAPIDGLPFNVALGAGSIKGRFPVGGDVARKRHAIGAPQAGPLLVAYPRGEVEVIALAQDGKGPIRRTLTDSERRFCVRYLVPGTYTLFAHSRKEGWSRIDDLKVASDVTDVGERSLVSGGTIRGSISYPRPSAVPEEVIATSPSQVPLRFPFEHSSTFDVSELGGLWPGKWTITVRTRDNVLATAVTEIKGTETVAVKLSARAEQSQ